MYAVPMTSNPPAKKKPGPPLRFPERVIVYVTTEMHQELEREASATDRRIPDVVREYIRAAQAAKKAQG